MNVGATIKKFRKERKMSRNELCFLLDISQTYLSQIEGNKKEMSFALYRQICSVMKISIGGLILLSLDDDDIKDVNKYQIYKTIYPLMKQIFL